LQIIKIVWPAKKKEKNCKNCENMPEKCMYKTKKERKEKIKLFSSPFCFILQGHKQNEGAEIK